MFRRDLVQTPVPMDRDTRLHFLRILRDGADLQGLEAYTADPDRFVSRTDVDWSNPEWVAEDKARATVAAVATQSKFADPPPVTANDTRPKIDSIRPLSSKHTKVHPAVSRRTHYDVLQVRHDAEPKAIETAYRWFALKCEPDMDSDPEVGRRMAELKAAYAVLADPVRRKHYDAELLWEGERMDTEGPQDSPVTVGEAPDVPAPVRLSFARRVGGAFWVLFLVAAGGAGLWLWDQLREKQLEKVVSQAHDWPVQQLTLEPDGKVKVSLRTRCSKGQLDYVLSVEADVPPPEVIDPTAPDGGKAVQNYNAARERVVKVAAQHLPFTLHFLDKDGFDRYSFSVPVGEIHQSVDSEGHVYGLNANGHVSCYKETYSQFASCLMSWMG